MLNEFLPHLLWGDFIPKEAPKSAPGLGDELEDDLDMLEDEDIKQPAALTASDWNRDPACET